jgi:Periplasmic protein involved in polysaccharide export
MKKIKLFTVFILSVSLFSSCLTTRQTNLLSRSTPDYPRVGEIGEYTIKPGDELFIQISVSEENSATARLFRLFSSQNITDRSGKMSSLAVSPEGTIYFPYVGDISVVGKTTLDIQQDLEHVLNQELFSEDESCIVYVRLNNRIFSVIGQSSVGNYAIAKEQLTIFQALSQSQDMKSYGNRAKVKILRQTESGTVIRTFDLRSEDIVNSEYYYVQPNDVIYIEPLGRQFWGISSFGAIFALISTVATLGLSTYNLIKK